jgi:hypothetical protein
MTENSDRKIITLENTRRITIELTNRGDADRFIQAINERRIRLMDDDTFVDAETGEVLAKRMTFVNENDYEMAQNQWPARRHDNCDSYDYRYNEI